MTATLRKSKGPAKVAALPDHGSINPWKGKNVNDTMGITPSAQKSSIRDLITNAESIAAQMRTSTDDEQLAHLSRDLLELNNSIIGLPVSSLAEVQEKAGYLLASDDPLDAGIVEPLLRSFVGKAAA